MCDPLVNGGNWISLCRYRPIADDKTHLLTHTSQLAHRLTFFTFLESSQRLLNTPSSTLVLSPDFLPMLQRLDECIGYLEQHVGHSVPCDCCLPHQDANPRQS